METEETENQGSAGGPPPVNHCRMGDLKNDVFLIAGSDLDPTVICSDNVQKFWDMFNNTFNSNLEKPLAKTTEE